MVVALNGIKGFIEDFVEYLKSHKTTIILLTIVGIFIYGLRISNYIVGIDTDLYLANPWHINKEVDLGIGRFGLSFLQDFFEIKGLMINIYAVNLFSLLFLMISTLIWCWIIDKYDSDTKTIGVVIFAIYYVSSPIWVENISFSCIAAENMLGVMLCPISVYFLWEGIICNEKNYRILSILILTLITSIYQPVLTLFFAGVMMVYVLQSDGNKIEGKRVFKFIIIDTILALLIYIILLIIFTKVVFNLNGELDGYLTGQIGGGEGVKKSIILICADIYKLFFGNTELFNPIIDPLIAGGSKRGDLGAIHFHETALHGCILYFFASIMTVVYFMRSKGKHDIWYYVAWIGIIWSVLAFIIVGGGNVSCRTLFAFALFGAFILYYSTTRLKEFKKFLPFCWIFLVFIFGYYQVQISSTLNTSDLKRYQQDKWFANEINEGIIDVKNRENIHDDLPVIVIGKYDFYRGNHYLKYQLIGTSSLFFGSESSKSEATHRTLAFLKDLGYVYDEVEADDKNIDSIRKESKKMPCYPENGWVEMYDDVIIVKVSDSVYAYE